MQNKWWAKVLRIIGITFMSLTAAFTIMGGVGTACVAINPTGYGNSLAPIAKAQLLYIIFVIVTTFIGVMGARAVVLLVKGSRNAYRFGLITLVSGIVLNGIHMAVSRSLRGSSMPVDMVEYTTLLTLIIFLIFRIPSIWKGVNFEKNVDDKKAGTIAMAIALWVAGFLTLAIPFLMAPTHTISEINYSNVWHTILTIIGIGLILAGVIELFSLERITYKTKSLPLVDINRQT